MSRRRRNPEIRPMTACERGNWIDTEGEVSPVKKAIEVTQEEREPLEDYCAGARKDGIPCRVIRYPKEALKPRYHRALIYGYENIAKELLLTQNCIRTKKRLNQIQAFKKHLLKPRKRRDIRVERAKKIFNI